MSEETKNEVAGELNQDDLDQIAGGKVMIDPKGSMETADKYLIMDDETDEVLAKTGGYRRARKIAAQFNQSPELQK